METAIAFCRAEPSSAFDTSSSTYTLRQHTVFAVCTARCTVARGVRTPSSECVAQKRLYGAAAARPVMRIVAARSTEKATKFWRVTSLTERSAYGTSELIANVAQYTNASCEPSSCTRRSNDVRLALTAMLVMLGARSSFLGLFVGDDDG